MIRDTLAQHLNAAIAAAALPVTDIPANTLGRGRLEGVDYASNVAMQLARAAKLPPVKIAEAIIKQLHADTALTVLAQVSVAGGYINFSLTPAYLSAQVAVVNAAGPEWGNVDLGHGHAAQVEFGSANPTGYATIGTGRNVIVGDTLANTLVAAGYNVHREWYVNDAGSQIKTFGASLFAHYAQHLGKDEPLPDKGYPGEDVVHVAREIVADHGDKFLAMDRADAIQALGEMGIDRVMEAIRVTLLKLNIRYDNFFSERSLRSSGLMTETLEMLRAKGLILEHDGAQWFSDDGSPIRGGQGKRKTDEEHKADALADEDASDEADTKDEKGRKLPIQAVVLRSARVVANPDERATYFASDIPYVWNKVKLRGFHPAVYVWGEDHQADVPRVYAAAKALGLPDGAARIVIYRFITLLRNGQEVRMGKRKGNAIWIDDVLGEIGADALRYIMLSRSVDTRFAFDLGVLKEANDTNPVYYVQYGHARICRIEEKAKEDGWEIDLNAPVNLEHASEQALMRKVLELPEVVEQVATTLQPHTYTTYARELGAAFSKFYEDCRIKDATPTVAGSRLQLARAVRVTLARVLTLMGMSTPERM